MNLKNKINIIIYIILIFSNLKSDIFDTLASILNPPSFQDGTSPVFIPRPGQYEGPDCKECVSFLNAARSNNITEMQNIISRSLDDDNFSMDETDRDNKTAMHYAVINGNLEMVQLLLTAIKSQIWQKISLPETTQRAGDCLSILKSVKKLTEKEQRAELDKLKPAFEKCLTENMGKPAISTPTPIKSLSVGSDAQVWSVNINGEAFLFTNNKWQQQSVKQQTGVINQISVGNHQNIKILNDSGTIFKWSTYAPERFVPELTDQRIGYISVGADGTTWAMGKNTYGPYSQMSGYFGHDVFKFENGKFNLNIDNNIPVIGVRLFTHISVGNKNNIIGIASSKNQDGSIATSIQQNITNSANTTNSNLSHGWTLIWPKYGGSIFSIIPNPTQKIIVQNISIPYPNDIVKRAYTASDSSLWALAVTQNDTNPRNSDGNIPYRLINGFWQKIEGDFKDISVGGAKYVWALDFQGNPYRWTGRRNIDAANIDAMSRDGTTPLMLACKTSKPEIIKYLVNNKADVTLKNKNKETALHIAIENNLPPEVILAIANAGADIVGRNAQNKNGQTPLSLAIGKNEILTTLINYLKSSPDVNIKSLLKETDDLIAQTKQLFTQNNDQKYKISIDLLESLRKYFQDKAAEHKAQEDAEKAQRDLLNFAMANNYSNAQKILSNKAITDNINFNIDLKDSLLLRSPILWAAYKGNLNLLKDLALKNANVDGKDINGDTPLLLSIGHTKEDNITSKDANALCTDKCWISIALYLLNTAYANPKTVNNQNTSPIQLSIKFKHADIIKALLDQGISLKSKDNLGNTPLHMAIATKDKGFIAKFAQIAVNNGDDLNELANIKNNSGETPISLANKNNIIFP